MKSDLKKIAAHYAKKTDDQLIVLAAEHELIREDVFPILKRELQERSLLKELKALEQMLTQPKEDLLKEKPTIELAKEHKLMMVTRAGRKSAEEETLDNEFQLPNFDVTDDEIIRKCVKIIFKNKKKLHSKNETLHFIEENFEIEDHLINEVFTELNLKKRKSYKIAVVIGAFFLTCNILLLGSGSFYILIPGWIILIIVGSNLITARHLRRLSS